MSRSSRGAIAINRRDLASIFNLHNNTRCWQLFSEGASFARAFAGSTAGGLDRPISDLLDETIKTNLSFERVDRPKIAWGKSQPGQSAAGGLAHQVPLGSNIAAVMQVAIDHLITALPA
jgi:hypothetical protein